MGAPADDAPFLPAHGSRALSDVMPAVAHSLGSRDPDATDVLGLPPARRWVVFLVDGLGWNQLAPHAASLPYLGPLTQRSKPITAGIPATTVTSITSLGTGLPPGRHGIAGYRFRLPERDEVFGPLGWDTTAAPAQVQPLPTWFDRLAAQGLAAAAVTPQHFEGSGLTACALRGATFRGFRDEADPDERLAQVIAAVEQGPGVTYAYDRRLDHTGHSKGVASWHWFDVLQQVDEYLAELREALPADVRLLVTGDHGMIDVPSHTRLTLEDDATLLAGVRQVGGEGRLRHLYTDPADHAAAPAVARRWAATLGDRAWVLRRDEAFQSGWFGAIDPAYSARFGDVIVAMRGTWAVMTQTLPKEFSLVGMHASPTPDEMLVPLLVD